MAMYSDTRDSSNILSGVSEQDIILAQQLDSATAANADLAAQFEYLKKKYEGIQDELQSALDSQYKLEMQAYRAESDLEAFKQREDEATRKIQDLETTLSKELKEFEIEKMKFSKREDQFKVKIKGLQNAQQQKLAIPTSPTHNSRLRSVSVSFSPPAYLSSTPGDFIDSLVDDNNEATLLHEAQLANRTVRQQLKEIGELKATVRQLKEQLDKQVSLDTLRVSQIDQLNKQVDQLNITNANQMEEIGSYQLLLEEKTLKGQFSLAHRSSSFNMSPDASPMGGFNLSSELSQAQSLSEFQDCSGNENELKPGKSNDTITKQMKDELQQMRDENKALALYISKILGKIMSNPVLAEAITHNGDSKKDRDSIKSPTEETPDNKKVPEPLKESSLFVTSPPKPEPKSRFAGFLSPTFGIVGFSAPPPASTQPSQVPNSRVSFDIPAPSPRKTMAPNRNSVDSACGDLTSPDKPNSGGQSPFRSRRTKSMSVSNVSDQLASDSQHSINKEAGGGVFSFRTALKKMAGPWKSSSSMTPKTISETSTASANST